MTSVKTDVELAKMLDSKLGLEHNFTTPDVAEISNIKKKLQSKGRSTKIGGFKLNSKTTKQQLLEQIRIIIEKNNKVFDPSAFKKYSKDDLARTLGELINQGFDKINGIDDEAIQDSLQEDLDEDQIIDEDFDNISEHSAEYIPYNEQEITQEPEYEPPRVVKRGRPSKSTIEQQAPIAPPTTNNISIDSAARSLFHLNKLVAKCVESFSEKVGPETVGITIDKYAENLEEEKDELLKLYRMIYLEHSEDLKKYVTPVNQVLMINFAAVANGIVKTEADNLKKS